MKKKIFKPFQIGSATALITISSLLSYVIGLFRDRVIAVSFGTTNATDAYNASFLIPDILFNLFIAGALSAAFLPVFSQYLTRDKKEAEKLAHTMITGATLLIGTLALITFIAMPYLSQWIFNTADLTVQQDITNMTRLMLLSAIFFSISNTLGNILMSYKHFMAYSLSPVFYNLGIILGVSFLSEQFGIYAAAIGVVIGAALHCLIRIIDITSTEYKYKFQLHLKHPGFKKILKLMVPKSISLIAWQLNLLLYGIVAIHMVEGGFTAFNYARNIQSFAVSLFGISFATAVFPYLANAVSENDPKRYTDHIQKTTQRILFFTIPATIGLMMVGEGVINLILGGGAFQEKSIELTSVILYFFALSIPFESLAHIFSRAFYAKQNTFTPMLLNLLGMSIIAGITYFLAPKLGIEWFSIGFTFGFAFYVISMALVLKKHFKDFELKKFLSSLSKTSLAVLLMYLSIKFSSSYLEILPEKIMVISQIILGGASFFLVAALIKSPELDSVHYIIKRVFKKV